MPLSSYIMSSHMIGQRHRLDTVADNVANVNTVGYKRQTLDFQELVSRQQGQEVGSFANHNGTRLEFVQGGLSPTGNPLDVAIMGEGFLAVQVGNNVHYTRNGHMNIDAEGQLVNDLGEPVLDANNAPINIPQDSTELTITSDGTVNNQNGAIAALGVYSFDNPKMMQRTGNNGYIPINQPAIPVETPRVSQGFLENSNVNAVQETVKMTDLARKYESAAQLINSMDELEQRAIRTLPTLQ